MNIKKLYNYKSVFSVFCLLCILPNSITATDISKKSIKYPAGSALISEHHEPVIDYQIANTTAYSPNSILIDFENNPPLSTAPNLFQDAGSVQQIPVEEGNIIINGGVVLGFPTNMPATPFSSVPNLYGTSNPGYTNADPSLSPSLTISISNLLEIYTVEGILFNGMTESTSYTISAYSGSSIVDTSPLVNLPPNTSSGYGVFKIDSNGQPITSVVFTPEIINGDWDYFIDTIVFDASIENIGDKPQISVSGGYIKLDTVNKTPPSFDCAQEKHEGRMVYDSANDIIYICSNSGWVQR